MAFMKQVKWMALPGILGIGLVYLLPGCAMFYYACINNVFQKQFVGLGNFFAVLRNPYFDLALKNTVALLILALATALGGGLLLVLPEALGGRRWLGLKLLLIIPLFMPSAISVELLNMIGQAWEPRLQLLALFAWRNTGAVFLLFSAGLATVDKEIIEAAKIDGALGRQIFRYIQLPVLRIYLGIGSVFLIMQFFGIFRESYILFGSSYPPDEVYLLQHYMYNHFLRLNYPYLASSSLLFTALLIVVIVLGRVFLTVKCRRKIVEKEKKWIRLR